MPDIEKGELEKLIIRAYTRPDYSGAPVGEFKMSFNPQEYTRIYDVEYSRQSQGDGTTGNPLVFRRVKPQEYNLKLLFDGTGVTGEKVDIYGDSKDYVSQRIEDFFHLVGYDGDIHRPRYLKLTWGNLESRCVLLRAEITYTVFYPNGKPLRAVMQATFAENVDDSTRVREEKASSPDLTHVRIVQEGDTLPLMTAAIYGDFSYYLEVARINKLNNFRQLKPGQKIFFPPIEKA